MLNAELKENSEGIVDYLRVLDKYKLLIAAIVAASFLVTVIVVWMLPDYYTSTTTILPHEYNSSYQSQLSSKMSQDANGFSERILGVKSPTSLWVEILKSRTIRNAVIESQGLEKYFNAPSLTDARRHLAGNVRIGKSRAGIISISVDDKDPEMAARMANAFVEELDRLNRDLIMSAGKKTRIFIEKRLNAAKNELAKVEGALRTFKETNKAFKLDDQSTAALDAIGSIQGKLVAKEVELKTLMSYTNTHNPKVEVLRTQVSELRKRINELQDGTGPNNSSPGEFLIPTIRIPALRLEYTRLVREAKVQESVYELLAEQYELARIQEAKDSPTIQVLDAAQVPDKAVENKAIQIVLISIIAAVVFSLFLAFFLDYIEKEMHA